MPCARHNQPRSAWLIAGLAALVALTAVIGPAPAPAQTDGPTRADQQYTFAVRLLQQNQADLAADAFEQFVRDHPGDPRVSDAHYYLALLARRAGDAKTAAAHLRQIARPRQVSPAAVDLLRGQTALEAGDADEAIERLENLDPKKLADDAARAARSYLLGVAYRRKGNLPAAAAGFEAAAKVGGDARALAQLELGKVQLERDQADAAAESLEAALEAGLAANRAAEARLALGRLAYRQKQFEKAAAYYQQIVEKHQSAPAFESATVGLLRSLYAAGENDKLIARHENLAHLLPASAVGETLYLRAAAHVRREQYDKAIGYLTRFIERTDADHPLRNEAVYLAGVCLYRTDPAKFSQWYDRHRPPGRELTYLRALSELKRDQPRYAAVVALLSRLVEPADAAYARRALLQRAVVRERMGEAADAAEDYALYAQRYGKDEMAGSLKTRAIDLAFADGRFERVVELARPLLQAPPEDVAVAPVRLKLAIALIKTDQPDAAAELLDQLLAGKHEAKLMALARFYRGLLLAARASIDRPGTIDAAVKTLRTARKADALPADQRTQALALEARLLRMSGDQAAAVAAYEALRQTAPGGAFDPVTALWVGQGLVEAGRFADAQTWLAMVIDHDKADRAAVSRAMFLAAGAHARTGDPDEAIDLYRRLITSGAGYFDQARLGVARALAAKGDLQAALDQYEELFGVDASAVAAGAYFESALIRRRLADRLEAAGDARAAAEHLGRARVQLNRVAILFNMPQLEPLPTRAVLELGRTYRALEEPAQARERFEQIADDAKAGPWRLDRKSVV